MLPLIYVDSLRMQLLQGKTKYWQLKNPGMALLLATRFSKITTLGKLLNKIKYHLHSIYTTVALLEIQCMILKL